MSKNRVIVTSLIDNGFHNDKMERVAISWHLDSKRSLLCAKKRYMRIIHQVGVFAKQCISKKIRCNGTLIFGKKVCTPPSAFFSLQLLLNLFHWLYASSSRSFTTDYHMFRFVIYTLCRSFMLTTRPSLRVLMLLILMLFPSSILLLLLLLILLLLFVLGLLSRWLVLLLFMIWLLLSS